MLVDLIKEREDEAMQTDIYMILKKVVQREFRSNEIDCISEFYLIENKKERFAFLRPKGKKEHSSDFVPLTFIMTVCSSVFHHCRIAVHSSKLTITTKKKRIRFPIM